MKVERHHAVNWPIENRPQDRYLNGVELTIEPADQMRPLPAAIKVTDVVGRSCIYVAASRRIVKERARPRTVMVSTLDHVFPDLMPQAIEVRDGEGNSYRYVAVNPLDDTVKLFARARRDRAGGVGGQAV